MTRFSYSNRPSFLLPLASLLALSGCLERDLGLQGPRTTSLISEQLRQAPPTKLDLLLVVDNSASMADKQVVLAETIPDLIRNLAEPPCVTREGGQVERVNGGGCPSGSAPDFEALTDIQVGVITTSLGSAGGTLKGNCDNEEGTDMAHLLPTRPRASHIPSDMGVLSWKAGRDTGGFIDDIRTLITLAGERGCGAESGLEAWYRFLIDPAPYTQLVRVPCREGDTAENCADRERGPDGKPAVDEVLLSQRAKFLRPDSLLGIIMLTDENDCSLREHPQAFLIHDVDRMRHGSAACDLDPNSPCCLPCGIQEFPEQCETETDDKGRKALVGCAANDGFFEEPEAPNLRCFDQKRRFGIDLLQPTARYVHALRSKELCPNVANNDPEACAAGQRIKNPLYAQSGPFARTSPEGVVLVGILGVPWQDIAVSPDPGERLEYLPSSAGLGEPAIDWSWLLTSDRQDPLMRESVEPRQGINPATGVALAPPGSPRLANPINGHEHANLAQDELQYACVFPLPEGQRACEPNSALVTCDCDAADLEADGNPLCQAPDGSFGPTQYFAKAYPGARQLEVLQGAGDSAVVASICAKDMSDDQALDYGYRPAMRAIVDKVKTKLSELCFDRELATDESGRTNCKVIELRESEGPCSCDGARSVPPQAVLDSVHDVMREKEICDTDAECQALCACEIAQVSPGGNDSRNSCQQDATATDDGWCYVDAQWGEAAEGLVSNCRDGAKRKVRFVGEGVPRESSITFLACQGSDYFED